ncbi:transglycosylase SLT domain-containing protein [Roseomonas haemaphysalidis]|uniref:Transglycosylase SLT domain-containing protein n=1 Tax=Roseomonas haemaphysalidis TaxID=2768162 RepID=A0ABS3KLA7_9PROT|nr:transglycosylase SLT domain-containing protein [Roseomonas haemaphysalidis]MBO1078240.1 transglycosylase SLT domain-containing protein [Roseomonas haemaphysalidis]
MPHLSSLPRRFRLAAIALATAGACAGPVLAQQPADWGRCRAAIAQAEAGSGVPPGLLGAIALVESGRRSPTGAPQPWPWSYNAAGEGRAPATKAAAIAEVQALQARGVRSIDVGCLQVNLLHHPDAFADLDAAFDPLINARYAVRFLKELRGRSGDWGTAIGRYHSGETERGGAYSRRVALARMGAAFNGGGGVPLPPGLMAGICAPGLSPMLMFGGAAEARRFMTPEARRRAIPATPVSNRPRLACLRPARR